MVEQPRKAGATTRQMIESPQGAVFVWAGPRHYAERLARDLGRGDLIIVPADSDRVQQAARGSLRQVIVDHAAPYLRWREGFSEIFRIQNDQKARAEAANKGNADG